MKNELVALRQAIGERKTEPICLAYLAFRKTALAGGKKASALLTLIEKKLSCPSPALIVSAFSHRHCFMCRGGFIPCKECDGTGTTERDTRCPQCRGLGLRTCDFCRGTDWAAGEMIPPEIDAAGLMRHRLAGVRRGLRDMDRAVAMLSDGKGSSLSSKRRRNLVRRLGRLRGRLAVLAGHASIEADNAKQLRTAARDLDKHLHEIGNG